MPLVACALAAAGCGGGDDREEVKRTLREFVAALNTRDGEALCEDLVTRDYVEKQTLAEGDKALSDCKRQLSQLRGLKVKLVEVQSVRVDGDRARARAVLSVQGQEQDQVYRLRREDGGWRIAAGAGG
jgi:ketosteroid isomerase-like protein